MAEATGTQRLPEIEVYVPFQRDSLAAELGLVEASKHTHWLLMRYVSFQVWLLNWEWLKQQTHRHIDI